MRSDFSLNIRNKKNIIPTDDGTDVDAWRFGCIKIVHVMNSFPYNVPTPYPGYKIVFIRYVFSTL